MQRPSQFTGFVGRMILIYGLLIIPWPGFNATYGRYFRALGGLAFAHESGPHLLRFEPVPEAPQHPLDTRLLLADRAQLDASGRGPVQYVALDSRGIGWVPTALLLALILATPLPWRRRVWALLVGLMAVHGLILISLATAICSGSMAMSPEASGPFWRQVVGGLEETLITQMGAGLVVPVLIWVLVALRKRDLVRWRGGAGH